MKKSRYDEIKYAIRKIEGLLEVTVLVLVYYFLWKKCYCFSDDGLFFGRGKYLLAGVYAVLMVIFFYFCESLKFGYLKLADVLVSQWIGITLADSVTYFQLCLIGHRMLNPGPILLLLIIDFVISFIFSYIFSSIYHRLYVPKDMIMIYGSENAITLKVKMDRRSDKYNISKLLSTDSGLEVIFREILDYDAVVLNDVSAEVRNDILKFCYQKKVRVYVVPKISDIINRGAQEICLFDTPLLLVKGYGLTYMQRFAKRVFDVIISMIAMIPGLPIMVLVGLAIKLDDGGPIFYKQERVTLDGRRFNILKFRSMIVDAEKEGKSIPATDKDPRITRVGKVIRKIRFDEVPQILNILKGDMSIVGPRPERTEHVEKFQQEIPEFELRTKVKGGLTGYAQVYGKYNTSPYDKLRLDLMYIENYSFILDIKLILMTIQVLMKPEATEGFDKIVNVDALQEIASMKEKI